MCACFGERAEINVIIVFQALTTVAGMLVVRKRFISLLTIGTV